MPGVGLVGSCKRTIGIAIFSRFGTGWMPTSFRPGQASSEEIRMRNWLFGTSIVTAVLLGTQLAGAQSPAPGQAGGAASQVQGAQQNGAPQGSRQAEEAAGASRSGTDVRSVQQEGRADTGERNLRQDEQRSRTSEERRGDDRSFRADRDDQGGRRFEEGRRHDEGRRYSERRRYDEGHRYDERRRFDERERYDEGRRYGERYEERRYGSRMERGYAGPRNLQVTRRQRARVRDVIARRHVEPAHVDFPVRIGARVPDYVTSYDLPDEIYDYAPGYEGYRYFIANDDIVIVDPDSMEVVSVIED
jgi:hypothetical protein